MQSRPVECSRVAGAIASVRSELPPLPYSSDAVSIQMRISADDRKSALQRLYYQDAIEGVPMMKRQGRST